MLLEMMKLWRLQNMQISFFKTRVPKRQPLYRRATGSCFGHAPRGPMAPPLQLIQVALRLTRPFVCPATVGVTHSTGHGRGAMPRPCLPLLSASFRRSSSAGSEPGCVQSWVSVAVRFIRICSALLRNVLEFGHFTLLSLFASNRHTVSTLTPPPPPALM